MIKVYCDVCGAEFEEVQGRCPNGAVEVRRRTRLPSVENPVAEKCELAVRIPLMCDDCTQAVVKAIEKARKERGK